MQAALGFGSLLVAAGFAGCLLEPFDAEAEARCVEAALADRGPLLHRLPLRETHRATDPRQGWDAMFFIPDRNNTTVTNVAAPPGWTVESEWLGSDANATNVNRIRLTPSSAGPPNPTWGFNARRTLAPDASCSRTTHIGQSESLQPPEEGALAAAGKGVHVYTAGFWENGTLFYTNMESVHTSDWPRAGWYAWDGGGPLRVYVYDQAPAEKPVHWTAEVNAPPLEPVTLWNYTPTILGFNEALKGLSDSTARVVWIPPEKAYTRPGRENHVLYGDALIFWIRIDRVVDIPCPDLPTGSVVGGSVGGMPLAPFPPCAVPKI